jgi:hypothetical protein
MNPTENKSKARRYEFVLGPASFFDMSEILEGASLKIDIQSDGVSAAGRALENGSESSVYLLSVRSGTDLPGSIRPGYTCR